MRAHWPVAVVVFCSVPLSPSAHGARVVLFLRLGIDRLEDASVLCCDQQSRTLTSDETRQADALQRRLANKVIIDVTGQLG